MWREYVRRRKEAEEEARFRGLEGIAGNVKYVVCMVAIFKLSVWASSVANHFSNKPKWRPPSNRFRGVTSTKSVWPWRQ